MMIAIFNYLLFPKIFKSGKTVSYGKTLAADHYPPTKELRLFVIKQIPKRSRTKWCNHFIEHAKPFKI